MITINEKDIGNYEVIVDGEPVSLSILIHKHQERLREINFNIAINRKQYEKL